MSDHPPQSLTVTTGDGRILDVLTSGPEDGTTLVFHTGTPWGLVPMPPMLDLPGSGIRTVLYARPGYARSTPQPGRLVAGAAEDTAAVLDALGVDRFVNIGWSGGGPHALACQALLGERCAATTIIAGLAPYVADDASDEVRNWFEADEDNQLALAGDIDGFRRSLDTFMAQMSQVTASALASTSRSAADQAFLTEPYAEWAAACFRESYASGSDGGADDFLAFFQHWGYRVADAVGVAIWHGDDDQNVPLCHGSWLGGHLPGAELRVFENEGHLSIIGHFFDMIDDLVSRAKL